MKTFYYNYHDKHDFDQVVIEVVYSDTHEAFICEWCVEGGLNFTHLHATEGGTGDNVHFRYRKMQVRTLRRMKCLICDLPVARSVD